MTFVPVFKKIYIADILSLNSGWKTSFFTMVEIGKKLLQSKKEEEKIELGFQFYGNNAKNILNRTNNLVSIINNIAQNKYILLLKFENMIRLYDKGKDGITIDDGRHRLVALRILEVEKFPVIQIEPLKVEKEKRDKLYSDLIDLANQEIQIFLKSEEWKNYQQTFDYQKAFIR